jgi:hypothetical protein
MAKPARPRQQPKAFPYVEELSSRLLPNAGSFGLASGHLFSQHDHAFVSDASNGSTITDGWAASLHGGDGCAARATLVATLTDASGASGQASFNATTGVLNVQVQGAAASTSLNVAVDGTMVGTVTTDTSGNGRARLSNVTAQAGSTITVGDLQGALSQLKLTASLSGATGVTGSADFNTLRDRLHVAIRGAAPNTAYNVMVNDVVVGQVTSNSSGSAKLNVSPSSGTIQAGSTISVSDTLGNAPILQGTFA